MISNMDVLMFLISAIFAIIIVTWMASSNNKIGNYGVGENDPPTTNPPRLPRTRTVNCSPPKGSKPSETRNQYGISTRVSENRDKTIPPYMDYDIKPPKEDETINEEDFDNLRKRIKCACGKSGMTYEQALAFLVEYYGIKEEIR